MTQFNPLFGSLLQTPMVQQRQSAEKASQIRRTQMVQKNAAQRGDVLEHQVESSEELQPSKEQRDEPKQGKKRRGSHGPQPDDGDGREHVDLTA